MATTSPDNLKTPDAGDQYALVQDLGALADTVQNALVKRANSYVGTSAQRTAFTTAPNGTTWQDTNGTRREYIRTAGTWRGKSPLHGMESITGAAGLQSVSVSFPAGYFASAPQIQLTAASGTSTVATIAINAQAISTTGFVIRMDRSAAPNDFKIMWTAFPLS